MRSDAGRLRSRSRPAVWVGEGETRAQTRQPKGFSRDESLERERAEPAVAHAQGPPGYRIGVAGLRLLRGSQRDSQGTRPLSGSGQSPP